MLLLKDFRLSSKESHRDALLCWRLNHTWLFTKWSVRRGEKQTSYYGVNKYLLGGFWRELES